jgi:hypothetical protein
MLFVAAIAAFCAYHVNWIRQRHAFLEKYASEISKFAATFDLKEEKVASKFSKPQ